MSSLACLPYNSAWWVKRFNQRARRRSFHRLKMISAQKIHLLAGLKVSGLDLRTRELDFYVVRYIAISGISSMSTCLSYVGIIKIKIPVRRCFMYARATAHSVHANDCPSQEYKQVGSEIFEHGSWEVRAHPDGTGTPLWKAPLWQAAVSHMWGW